MHARMRMRARMRIQSGKYIIGKHHGERGTPKIWENIDNNLNSNTIKVARYAPITLKQAFKEHRMDEMNEFVLIEKEEYIDGDYKRILLDNLNTVENM